MHSFVFTCFLLLQGVCLFSSIPVSTLKAGLPTLKEKRGCYIRSFIFAAMRGDLDFVKECMEVKGFINNYENRRIKTDKYVDSKDAKGNTALIWASSKGKLPVVEYLLDNGADINQIDRYGETALMKASKYGHFPVVKRLVDEEGGDLNRLDRYAKTALMWASTYGHLPVVKYLAEKGADLNIYYVGSVQRKYTALMWASEHGHLPVVKYLAEKGADITIKDRFGETGLMKASHYGHLPVVKYLAQKGADITIKNMFGKTAENLAGGEVKEKWSSEVANL